MVKLGRISYVNMAPVFYRVDAEVEEVQGVPTELNRMLVAGELDTAPISSIAYARNADKLRLLLDNIPNIKAYWIMMGLPMAQIALHFGANDVQGTVVREKIFQAAGATSGTEQKIPELVRAIQEAGRVPVQRDTLYNELRRW